MWWENENEIKIEVLSSILIFNFIFSHNLDRKCGKIQKLRPYFKFRFEFKFQTLLSGDIEEFGIKTVFQI